MAHHGLQIMPGRQWLPQQAGCEAAKPSRLCGNHDVLLLTLLYVTCSTQKGMVVLHSCLCRPRLALQVVRSRISWTVVANVTECSICIQPQPCSARLSTPTREPINRESRCQRPAPQLLQRHNMTRQSLLRHPRRYGREHGKLKATIYRLIPQSQVGRFETVHNALGCATPGCQGYQRIQDMHHEVHKKQNDDHDSP
jgi:hypothetical protein